MNFEDALKNEDLQKIMAKAASKFTKQLDPDEIYTCKLNALWKAVDSHEEGKCKLTTYLFNNRHRKRTAQLHDNISDPKASGNLVDLYDELDSIPNGEMLKDRMFSNTIEDVASKHNYNRETTRRKLKKSAKILKERML